MINLKRTYDYGGVATDEGDLGALLLPLQLTFFTPQVAQKAKMHKLSLDVQS